MSTSDLQLHSSGSSQHQLRLILIVIRKLNRSKEVISQRDHKIKCNLVQKEEEEEEEGDCHKRGCIRMMVSCCLFITSSKWLNVEQTDRQIVNNAVKSGSTDHISLLLCHRFVHQEHPSEKRFGGNVTFNQREQVDLYLVVGDYQIMNYVCTNRVVWKKKLDIYLFGFQES